MFAKSFKLLKLFGFEVRIDLSWLILAFLIVWSLAVGLFPHLYKNLSNTLYWAMSIIGGLGLFMSVIFHELCHSLIARHYGISIRGITLFVFGGVAQMEDEPRNPKSEFFMAIVGPISSVILGTIFYVIKSFAAFNNWHLSVIGITSYLTYINWVLAGFNLIPAFPLDGGRVLRAILWTFKKNLRWATRIASTIGSAFSYLMMFFGIIQFFLGDYLSGIWIFMIGMFLQGATQASYKQLIIRQVLEVEKVSKLMQTNPITVAPLMTIQELVDNYIYKYHFKMFPVAQDGDLTGCITTKEVKEIPKSAWQSTKVQELASHCSIDNTVDPDTDVVKALGLMNRTNRSRIMVVKDKKLVGILTLKDIMRFLSLKMDLENEDVASKDSDNIN